ncbi:hypothetical protein TSUD_329720 [Trifolium subterraneum]|nr:hypothetical protein TSUD_329720 [Trifolium subterraneum]
MERRVKKIKGGEQAFSTDSSMPVSYADIGNSPKKDADRVRAKSYKESVMGEEDGTFGYGTCEHDFSDTESDMDARQGEEHEFAGMEVVERELGGHACPDFVLTQEEERRIQKPWRNGVLVKLLGRKIGYKALETRLKQMWVRNGIINIVDVGHDFFLVTFTNKEDHYRALIEGPWLIYDNYLVVREWSPNFHPAGEVIKHVAVWVRFSGLPIEYYDTKMLHFIGNRIGRTVKVDRTTQSQARGKYARLCVEVDLTKPLLAMFQIKDRYYKIKDRYYKVEYEGLHMLCLACGTFGHYKEGCVAKTDNRAWNGEQQGVKEVSDGANIDAGKEGPWMVVQKPRQTRKKTDGGKMEGTMVAGGAKNIGSRYAVLSEHIPRLDDTANNNHGDELVTNNEMENDIVNPQRKSKQGDVIVATYGKKSRNNSKGGDNHGKITKNKNEAPINCEPILVSQVTPMEITKTKVDILSAHKVVEKVDAMNEERIEAHVIRDLAHERERGINEGCTSGIKGVISSVEVLGQTHIDPNHVTRPPDTGFGSLPEHSSLQRIISTNGSKQETGSVHSTGSQEDMEIVEETPKEHSILSNKSCEQKASE